MKKKDYYLIKFLSWTIRITNKAACSLVVGAFISVRISPSSADVIKSFFDLACLVKSFIAISLLSLEVSLSLDIIDSSEMLYYGKNI